MSDRDVSGRKFFMHAAHQTIGVSGGLAALQGYDLRRFPVGAPRESTQRETGPRVCLVSGSPRYKSDESLAALQAHLENNTPTQCTRAFARSKSELPGLHHLDRCDCMLLFTRRMEIEGRSLERIKAYCRRGGPIVAVRTAGHGLQNWPTMDKDVLGGDYQGHYDNRIAGITLVESAKQHPVLTGVRPFVAHGTLYKNRCLATDAKVLLTGSFPDHSHPVAWTRPNQSGRVFCTSLGHPDDFQEPDFLRLLTNAIFWTTRQV
jgi:type 1 glutamine amidotransferase